MTAITVSALVNATPEHVWDCWTQPKHIVQWNHASDDWETTASTNDVRVGGKFSATMAAKDGSVSFDFTGAYTQVRVHEFLAYAMPDGRKVTVRFERVGAAVQVTETFDAETMNPAEMQRQGWQAILDNFKAHAEQ